MASELEDARIRSHRSHPRNPGEEEVRIDHQDIHRELEGRVHPKEDLGVRHEVETDSYGHESSTHRGEASDDDTHRVHEDYTHEEEARLDVHSSRRLREDNRHGEVANENDHSVRHQSEGRLLEASMTVRSCLTSSRIEN